MLFLMTSVAFFLSLSAKLLADHFLASRVSIIGSFVGLQPSANSGVAFGITFPGPLQWILIVLAVGALGATAVKSKTTWSRVAFGLIIGGALGNIADRLFDGLVTDFFQVGTFPIFNVADSCISIGVFLLLLELLAQWRRP